MIRTAAFFGTAAIQLGLYALGQQATGQPTVLNESTLIPIGLTLVGCVSVVGLTWKAARSFQSIEDRLSKMETFFNDCKNADCPIANKVHRR